jgi:hypothetical protein
MRRRIDDTQSRALFLNQIWLQIIHALVRRQPLV